VAGLNVSRLDQIQQMLLSEPDDVFLNFALAMEQVKAGHLAEAADQFARVIQLDPHHTAAYSQRAGTLIALGRKDEAKAVLNEGIAAAGRTGDKHAADQMRQAISLLG